MEQEFSNVTPAPKKNNTVLIVAAVIVALLCCCCVLIVGGFSLLGPTVSETFESIEQTIPEEFEEVVPFEDGGQGEGDEGDTFNPGFSDVLPSGGLGDEILRTDIWLNLNFASAMNNCIIPPDGAQKTNIEVLQDPDSAGVWVERWTVPCDSGEDKSFDITFTPTDNGTDFSIQTAE